MPTGLRTINFAIGLITSVVYMISITLLHDVKSYPCFSNVVVIGHSSSMWYVRERSGAKEQREEDPESTIGELHTEVVKEQKMSC